MFPYAPGPAGNFEVEAPFWFSAMAVGDGERIRKTRSSHVTNVTTSSTDDHEALES